MKSKRLNTLILLLSLLALPSVAQNFTYEGINYTITSLEEKTCKTKEKGNPGPAGNSYEGDLVIPAKVSDGTDEYTVVEIGWGSFYGCTTLISVILPETVKTIASDAFFGCKNLKKVSLPDTLTDIYNSAFNECSNLETINIPSSLTEISDYVFGACLKLDGIVLPENLTSIGERAFESCSSLSSIHLPETLTSIGRGAFSNCTSITTIEIPELVKEIGSYTFSRCLSLTSVELPESMNSIGESAFNLCEKLTSIKIPEGVTKIGDNTFKYCKSLESVQLPSTLTEIWNEAFYNCESLDNIILPSGLQYMDTNAFHGCTSLTSVEIPNSMTKLSHLTFSNCTSLSSVTIPSSITSIESQAFDHCTSLRSIKLPDTLTILGPGAFESCTNLIEIELPESLTSIGHSLFKNCNNLSAVSLPKSMTVIPNDMFYNCSNLKSIDFPDNLTAIKDRAFCYSGLTSIVFPETLTDIGPNAFSGSSDLTSIVFPKDMTFIGNTAFSSCSSLTSITFPVALETIGSSAFSNCDALTSLTFPESLTSIVDSAFSDCSGLTSITFPESLKLIGGGAFYRCSGLTSVTFPEALETIDKSAFTNCFGLTSINFPESLISIGPNAFYRCTSLPAVVLPASLQSIGDGAFMGDFEIKEVTYYAISPIPGDEWFFQGATYDSATLKMPNATLEVIQSIYPWNRFKTIIAKDGTIQETQPGPSVGDEFEYQGLIYTIEDVELKTCKTKSGYYSDGILIGGNNYDGALELPEIVSDGTYEYTVVGIGDFGFSNCQSLTSVSLPESIATIGLSAFEGCPNLMQITIPNLITVIESRVFTDCPSLISVALPLTLISINDKAFFGCTSLPSISLPGSLDYIGDDAFGNCSALMEVVYTATSPISASPQIFAEEIYPVANLKMQYASLEDIQATVPWNLFTHMEANNGTLPIQRPQAGTEFEYEGIRYTITDSEKGYCKTSDNVGLENVLVDNGDFVLPQTVSDGTYDYTVTEIGYGGFSSSQKLTSITLPPSITYIEGNVLRYCPRLTSVVWQSHQRLTDGVIPNIDNPNLLLYVDSLEFAPRDIAVNIVVCDTQSGEPECQQLILEPSYPFRPIKSFTSLNSRFTKEFTQMTPIDGCSGWETIVLPFDVTSVSTNDMRDDLIPFANLTNIETQYPYWLYEADPAGEWKEATGIFAGIPYLISMPDNEEYAERYRINGPVTFSNPNPVRIASEIATPYSVTWASGHQFRSLWLPLDEQETKRTMGLNANIENLTDNNGEILLPGSAFHIDVVPRPLEAYVATVDAQKVIRVRGGSLSGINLLSSDQEMSIEIDNGVLRVKSSTDRKVELYRIDGLRIKTLDLKSGEEIIIDDLARGLYIIAGHKIIVK